MICTPCKIAADMHKPLQHGYCLGATWCDCQHVGALDGQQSESQGTEKRTGETTGTVPGSGVESADGESNGPGEGSAERT